MSNSIFKLTQVAASVPYDNTTSGYGTGDVQTAIDALAVALAGGIANYNVVSSTAFATSANSDTIITGMTVTPLSGTYAIWYNAENTGSGSGQSLYVTIYKAGVAVSDSLRKSASPAGTHEFTTVTMTIAQFNGSQACDVRVNANATSVVINQKSLLMIRLGP
jgi:hypothetical protein